MEKFYDLSTFYQDGETLFELGQHVYFEKDEDGRLFFEANGNREFIDSFKYMTVDELIDKINSSQRENVTVDEVYATFINDTDNVGIITKLYECDETVKPFFHCFGFGGVGELKELLCVPSERQYEKSEWTDIISIEPYDESIRDYYISEEFRFVALADLIISGEVKLVSLSKHLGKNNCKILK